MIRALALCILAALTSCGEYVEFELDSVMTLGWEISEDRTVIDFTYKCRLGWCALGLGKGMREADILVALYPAEGSPSFMDTWSLEESTPPEDSSLGGLSDLTLISASANSKTFTMVLRRPLNTQDTFDSVIKLDEPMDFSYAYRGTDSFAKHTHTEQGTITFSDTQEESSIELDTADIEVHGTFMLISWNVFAPIAVIIARYFKWWRFWYWAHLATLSVAIVMTMRSAALAYLQRGNIYEEMTDHELHHSRLGLTMAGLVFGQGVMGLLTRYYMRSATELPLLAVIRRLHKILGWFLLLVGNYTVLTGWHLFENRWDVFFPMAIVGVFILLELKHQLGIDLPVRMKDSSEFTHVKTLRAVHTEEKQYVFFEEHIVDVAEFKFSHPGTAFLVKKTIGEDVGKYLLGCSSYGQEFLPYDHSKSAITMIRHLSIGRISAPEDFFEGVDDYLKKVPMQVHSVVEIATSTFLVTLTNDQYRLSCRCKHKSWLGKHFSVKAPHSNVLRYYSCMFVDVAQWATALNCPVLIPPKPEGAVQLIIKVYPDGKLTSCIPTLTVSSELQVSGPYGPGLALSRLDGEFVGVAGGTGIIPFLDLIHCMCNDTDMRDFRLTLVACFSRVSFALFKEVLDTAKSGLGDQLQIIWRFSDDEALPPVADVIADLKGVNPTRVWICGPSGFNRVIYKLLREEPKVEKKRIVLM